MQKLVELERQKALEKQSMNARNLIARVMKTPVHEVTRTDESLSVRVELPDVKKASEVDLEISTTRLKLVVPDRCGRAEEESPRAHRAPRAHAAPWRSRLGRSTSGARAPACAAIPVKFSYAKVCCARGPGGGVSDPRR